VPKDLGCQAIIRQLNNIERIVQLFGIAAAATNFLECSVPTYSAARNGRRERNDAQRQKLVDQVAGSLSGGVREPVLGRAFQYWKNVDAGVGQRIEDKVRTGAAPQPAEGTGES